jgi:hypothetical protein
MVQVAIYGAHPPAALDLDLACNAALFSRGEDGAGHARGSIGSGLRTQGGASYTLYGMSWELQLAQRQAMSNVAAATARAIITNMVPPCSCCCIALAAYCAMLSVTLQLCHLWLMILGGHTVGLGRTLQWNGMEG